MKYEAIIKYREETTIKSENGEIFKKGDFLTVHWLEEYVDGTKELKLTGEFHVVYSFGGENCLELKTRDKHGLDLEAIYIFKIINIERL